MVLAKYQGASSNLLYKHIFFYICKSFHYTGRDETAFTESMNMHYECVQCNCVLIYCLKKQGTKLWLLNKSDHSLGFIKGKHFC